MTLKDSNTWLILTLVVTTLLGPGVVWQVYQQKNGQLRIEQDKEKLKLQERIDNLKIQIDNEKLTIQKNDQLIKMYEKLSTLMEEQRELYDKYESTNDSFQMQRIRLKMSEKYHEIDAIKNMIANLSGKKPEEIKGHLPPFKPRSFK